MSQLLTLSNTNYTIPGYSKDRKLKLSYYDSKLDPASSSSDQQSDAEKPVLVLIHGYCGSSAYFSRLIGHLRSSYRLLIPDLIGHGSSDADDEPIYQLDKTAVLLAGWLQGIGITEAYIFGHSLGGYITLALARQMPELVKGFGLLHSTALPDSEQARLNRERAIQTVEEQGVAAFVDGLVPKLLAAEHSEYEELLAIGTAIGYETAPNAVIGFARGMKDRVDHTAVIESSSKPVLLIAGDKDRVVSPESTFAGKGSTSSCHIIEQAGHMGMLEAPVQMAAIIKQFIG